MYHLPPLHDQGLTPMLLMRFSPYHQCHERYGITNVRPLETYKYIFPRSDIDLNRLACYFDYDHPDHRNEELKALYLELAHAIDQWRRYYRKDSLIQTRGPGFVQIVDSRVFPNTNGQLEEAKETVIILSGLWAEMFSYSDEVRTETEVLRTFADKVPEEDILAFLNKMVAQRLIYRSPAGQLLNLPLLKEVKERYQPVVTKEAVMYATSK
jgi:hypothetical protein